MTSAGDNAPFDPEVALAITYAPVDVRAALTALWRFDARLGQVLRTTRDPMLGQIRLTWWHEAAGRPERIAGEPVLAGLAAAGFDAALLQAMVEGWEHLLDDPDDAALSHYAAGRGGGLFAAAANVLGCGEPVDAAGAGWALVDLARHHSDPAVARRALDMAHARLFDAPRRWSRAARPLGILTKLARRDVMTPEPQGSPRRLLAAAALALTGR